MTTKEIMKDAFETTKFLFLLGLKVLPLAIFYTVVTVGALWLMWKAGWLR